MFIKKIAGICFLGGVPRVGAYFVVPITIEFTAKKYLEEQYKDRPKEWFDQVRQYMPTLTIYFQLTTPQTILHIFSHVIFPLSN